METSSYFLQKSFTKVKLKLYYIYDKDTSFY